MPTVSEISDRYVTDVAELDPIRGERWGVKSDGTRLTDWSPAGYGALADLLRTTAKTVRAYAVTAKNALPAAPDIPTVDAAGLPGLYMAVWHGLWAPKGTPADVVTRLNAAAVDALADANVRSRLAELGQDFPALDQQSPQALGAFQKAEIEKWWPIIKAANIKAE